MLKKCDAVGLLSRDHKINAVTNQTIFFANINKRKDVWWLEIPKSKIKTGNKKKLTFLLFDHRAKALHHLVVPVSFLENNLLQLVQRARKYGGPVISLELSADQHNIFKDIRPTAAGVRFERWKHCSIQVVANSVGVVRKSGLYQKQRRNQRKEDIIKAKGGGCFVCGYDKSASALVFHHRNEKVKEFNISGQNLNKYPLERLTAEAKKCDLLCANCHAEIHDKEGWLHENGKRTIKTSRPIARLTIKKKIGFVWSGEGGNKNGVK